MDDDDLSQAVRNIVKAMIIEAGRKTLPTANRGKNCIPSASNSPDGTAIQKQGAGRRAYKTIPRRTKTNGGMCRNIQSNKEALQTTKEAAPVREKRQPGVNTYAVFLHSWRVRERKLMQLFASH